MPEGSAPQTLCHSEGGLRLPDVLRNRVAVPPGRLAGRLRPLDRLQFCERSTQQQPGRLNNFEAKLNNSLQNHEL